MSATERQFILAGGTRWAYTEHGSEGDFWITFHGYGQDAEAMHRFVQHLMPDAHAIHFDLPHHGQTVAEHESLILSDLTDLVGRLLREKGVGRCSLLAFSLGGKVALKLAELMPGKIDRMILIAPDGLYVNPLYNFTANTRMGGWLYGRVARNPSNLFAAARLLRQSHILHPKVEQFMHRQLDTREKREQVYRVWRAFRHIVPDLREVRNKIVRYSIDTVLVLGAKDRIIRPTLGSRLDNGRTPQIRTILLNRGHDLITSEVAKELADALKAPKTSPPASR